MPGEQPEHGVKRNSTSRCSVCDRPFQGSDSAKLHTLIRGSVGEWQCFGCYKYYDENGVWPDEDGQAGQTELQVYTDGGRPGHGLFHIEATPTDDDGYNRIHTECETIATAILMEHDPVGQKIVGIFRIYRDFISEALDEADAEVTDDQFIGWLQHSAKHRGEIGNWEDDAFEALDELFIQNIEDTDHSPREVFDLFDRYVDETTEKFEQTHGMEGFFDNAK